jgi:hypothetical protein
MWASVWCAEPVFRIPPVAATVDVAGQPVRVTVSGSVFATAADDGSEAIRVDLNTDLADFERQLTPILAAQLNQSNHCGERLTVLDARLLPAAPAGLLTVTAHVEKWACAKAFHKEIVTRLVGGDGVLGVRLTPRVESGQAVKLAAEVTSVEADGSLGELLRTGAFADAIREKIRATVAAAIQKSPDFHAAVPAALQGIVSIQSVQFADGGGGRVALEISAAARIPAWQAQELLDRLKPQAH